MDNTPRFRFHGHAGTTDGDYVDIGKVELECGALVFFLRLAHIRLISVVAPYRFFKATLLWLSAACTTCLDGNDNQESDHFGQIPVEFA